MNNFFKILCLSTYLLALAVPFVALPMDLGPYVQKLALILIAAHLIELPLAYRHLAHYKGPFIDSVALSLLYGLVHWLPLSKAGKRSVQE